MRKKLFVVGVLALVLIFQVVLVMPVAGITQATRDETKLYSSVGILSVDKQDGAGLWMRCSGTLIGPTYFLVNGFCVYWIFFHPNWKGYISFDNPISTNHDLEGNNWFQVTDFVLQPLGGNAGNGGGGYHDLAVFILPEDFTAGRTPATLATAGLLDDLSAQNGLKGVEFITAGYGVQVDWEQGPVQSWWDGWRNYTTAPFQALTQEFLHINMNEHATGGGGGCWGDSGAPLFLPMNGDNILVGVALRSDMECRAMGAYYRLDTPWAQEFLSQFVELP